MKQAKTLKQAVIVVVIGSVPSLHAWSAGVVGTGTPVSCTEAALDTALTGGGTVTFNCGAAPTTINITSFKNISAATTVDGGGLITLDGGGTTHLFHVSDVTFQVIGLTLRNGYHADVGGAITSFGNNAITALRSTFRDNHAAFGGGAIYAGGSVSIDACLFEGNGTNGNAGAVFAGDGADIVNSTFANNTATAQGSSAQLGNTSTIRNITFVGTGNLLFATGTNSIITLMNSILSSTGATSCAVANTASFADGGGNLRSNGSDISCGAGIPSANPLLQPLAENGGPTRTMALSPNSPAIDAAVQANCPAADQRGIARPLGAGCDIGAYEFDPAAPPMIATQRVPTLSAWGLGALSILITLLAQRNGRWRQLRGRSASQ